MAKNNTLKYRVRQLEKKVDKTHDYVWQILTNDLPHLSNEVSSMKSRISTLILINGAAIIVGILISKFL